MPLTIEQVNRMSKAEMLEYIRSHEEIASIDVFGVQMRSIFEKLQISELREVLLGVPHVRNQRNPSWFDLFINTREHGIVVVAMGVTKNQMRKLLEDFNALRNMPWDELVLQPPSVINLRTIASRFGYVRDNSKLLKSHIYCEMVGLPCLKYGYQSEVKLLAKYFGLGSAEHLPSRFSFEFLGMQPYPKTIDALANIDEERFNRDVIIARESLKVVIHRMRRAKLVKFILAKYGGHHHLTDMTSAELDDVLLE